MADIACFQMAPLDSIEENNMEANVRNETPCRVENATTTTIFQETSGRGRQVADLLAQSAAVFHPQRRHPRRRPRTARHRLRLLERVHAVAPVLAKYCTTSNSHFSPFRRS